jgi:hypothetical protein
MTDRTLSRKTACVLLCAGVAMLAGCNRASDSQATNPAAAGTAPAPAGSTAQQAAPYTPPTADQLYQMVAPIALFPDKLVAQVLAGSTYPDQITTADNMLQQHPDLKGALLADAVNPQSWDPSVKGLTQFPSVLDQMAQNIQWTTALGEAYVNDPADVMNAIQVMRQRAQSNGSLRSSAQMQVVSQGAPAASGEEEATDDGTAPTYSGPAVVPAPQQTIEILPAQPDTVYVPQYDPAAVYGEPVAAYPGYTYVRPSGYSTGQMVATGAIAFGVGVVVGTLLEHHHDSGPAPGPGWGWNSWGVNWGRSHGRQRPAVVHNNTVYVSRSTTVVNRYVNNSRTINYINSNNRTVNNNSNTRRIDNSVHNTRVDNRRVVNGRPSAAAPKPATQAMAMPHFGTPVRGAEPSRPAQHATPSTRPVEHAATHEAPHSAAAAQPHPATPHAAARRAPVRAAAPRPAQRPPEHAPQRPAARAQARPTAAAHPAARPAPPAHHENAKAAKQPQKKRKEAQQH